MAWRRCRFVPTSERLSEAMTRLCRRRSDRRRRRAAFTLSMRSSPATRAVDGYTACTSVGAEAPWATSSYVRTRPRRVSDLSAAAARRLERSSA